MTKEWAAYQGDDFIMIGKTNEIAKRMNVKPEYVRWCASPSGQKRAENASEDALIILDLDAIEDDEDV